MSMGIQSWSKMNWLKFDFFLFLVYICACVCVAQTYTSFCVCIYRYIFWAYAVYFIFYKCIWNTRTNAPSYSNSHCATIYSLLCNATLMVETWSYTLLHYSNFKTLSCHSQVKLGNINLLETCFTIHQLNILVYFLSLVHSWCVNLEKTERHSFPHLSWISVISSNAILCRL